MLRHDLIKRLIEKMAAFLARLAGLIETRSLDEAARELAELEQELALPRGYEALDTRSLALLVGHADKVALACLIFWHRAEIAVERGRPAEAARLQVRARELCRGITRSDLSPPALELLAQHPVARQP